ncbi:MAG: DEAD/DEAH box helicase [Chloroflexota bacterium]|jgi:DEAD/DEAH box helicase domain-containing protein
MNLTQVVDSFLASEFAGCVTAHRRLPAREAVYAPFPQGTDPRLISVLRDRGIQSLYSHQAEALAHVQSGRNLVVVTPTASGKTLCYNVPVLDAILKQPETRALYLFPTKALSQDQLAELHGLVEALDVDIKTYTYDGDTPGTARRIIRSAGHIVVTNPDMLHAGILPHHSKWVKLFENLRYVVIDELHTYRGVFGSHLGNLLRRLQRVCRHYGSDPQFICCSATIANPKELAERLLEEPVELVDRSGAPAGARDVIFYNPPVINRQLGIRRSALLEARRIAERFLVPNDIQTILFSRSRLSVEVLLTYMREAALRCKKPEWTVRGYRGGYLPNERRAIERGIREGNIRTVVSTNALELGIDIGGLEASVLVGYPGTIASSWQQMGRAGRRRGESLALFIASSDPLDQYIVGHPDYFFDQSPESGLVNPDNLLVMMDHLKCAAFELPFWDGEPFGTLPVGEMLEYLGEERVLHHARDRWYWMSEAFPAESVGLRAAARENFVIVDTTDPQVRVIGEVDRFSAPMLIHEEAIYLHGSEQYQVERLDYENKKAYVRHVDVDYYTDANLAVNLAVLEEFDQSVEGVATRSHGEVNVTALATIFKKIKFDTHENIGSGPIHLPEESMHTTAYWLTLLPEATREMGKDALQAGLLGLANALGIVATVMLMCDRRDLRTAVEVSSPHTGAPTIYLYEAYPGGVGFSEKLYRMHGTLLEEVQRLIAACDCERGCPSCVGPLLEVGEGAKGATRRILDALS